MTYPGAPSPSDPAEAQMLTYAAAVSPLQEQLKRALIQFSGFALITLTRAKPGIAEFDLIEAARASLQTAEDGLHNLRVPKGADHAHRHFLGTAHFLARCRNIALKPPCVLNDEFHKSLEEAQRHFTAACRATPGLAPVDLTQACCAPHALTGGAATTVNMNEGTISGKVFHLGA